MKHIFNILIPFIVLSLIFFGFQIWKKNYDLRYINIQNGQAVILKKEIMPAGTTPTYRIIGHQMMVISVLNQEEPTVFLKLNGKEVQAVINIQDYKSLTIGKKIKVSYYTPKYYGNPFAIKLEY